MRAVLVLGFEPPNREDRREGKQPVFTVQGGWMNGNEQVEPLNQAQVLALLEKARVSVLQSTDFTPPSTIELVPANGIPRELN